MYQFIVNPKTNRKLKTNSKKGKLVLQEYINNLTGGSSKCKDFHKNPIKCHTTKEDGTPCIYSAKSDGTCSKMRKNLDINNIDKYRESSRRRGVLEDKFKESAAIMIQKKYKRKKNIKKFRSVVGEIMRKKKVSTKRDSSNSSSFGEVTGWLDPLTGRWVPIGSNKSGESKVGVESEESEESESGESKVGVESEVLVKKKAPFQVSIAKINENKLNRQSRGDLFNSAHSSDSRNYIRFSEKIVDDLYGRGYIFEEFLGKGGYGLALKFKDHLGNTLVIKGIYISKNPHVKKAIDIAQYMKSNIEKCGENSDFVLNFNYLDIINRNHYFSSEITDGDLFDYSTELDYMDTQRAGPIRYSIIKQLIYGIHCLHSIGVTHGDIKLENIFIIKSPLTVKFADFDGVGIDDLGSDVSVMTRDYMSYGTTFSNYTKKDDIYSLGIVFLYIYGAFDIVEYITDTKDTESINSDDYRELDSSISEDYVFLRSGKLTPHHVIASKINNNLEIPEKIKITIIQMLDRNKDKRPSANELYELYKNSA